MKFKKEIKIIQTFIENLGPISRTKIVKLLYLLDVESVNKFNKRFTNFKYIKYFYGPYDEKIVTLLEKGKYFTPQLGFISGGGIFHIYGVGNEKVEYDLDPKITNFLAEHIDKYKDKSLDEVINDAYSTEQFTKTAFGKVIPLD